MADLSLRTSSNVPGAFYVDDSCIDCDMCRSSDPETFRRDETSGLSVVYRQPVTPLEIKAAEEAMEACPTNSIGNDGEDAAIRHNG